MDAPSPIPGLPALVILDEPVAPITPAAASDEAADPATILLTCANCGARMDERKCKLICQCGYFLSCSDYY